ncbi:MAG TPA: EpsI family protein [Methylotenera sp.]|nr:EpsI family protein [Methylotenera sp.]
MNTATSNAMAPLNFSWNKSLVVCAFLLLSALSALLLTPRYYTVTSSPDLAAIVPTSFKNWKEVKSPYTQVGLTTDKNSLVNQLYDGVLMRTYVNDKGNQVMLALAYAREQKQDIKIHRPEVCYVAQGFDMVKKTTSNISMQQSQITKPVAMNRLLMRGQNRAEAVSYWIRIGDTYPGDGMAARMKILGEGLHGKVLDGILVRASTVLDEEADSTSAYETQEAFLKDLLNSLPVGQQSILVAKS